MQFINLSARQFTPEQWAELYDCQLTDTPEHSVNRLYNVERTMVQRSVVELEQRIDGISLGMYREVAPGDTVATVAMLRGLIAVLNAKLARVVVA